MQKVTDRKKKSYGYRFAMLHRLHAAICRQDILRTGIKISQFPFLLELVQEEHPVTQECLSKQIAMDKGTTARAIGQLEKAGLVTRVANPQNRRQNLVSATPKGHAVSEELFTSLEQAAEIYIQGMSSAEQDAILMLMDRMIANAQKALDDRTALCE